MMRFLDFIKDSPSVGDVHVANTSRRRRRRSRQSAQTTDDPPLEKLLISVPIAKINDELRTVYGWATVNAHAGQTVTDLQDDQIIDQEMTRAAHEFIASSRTGGLLHARQRDGTPVAGGQVVESMVLTADVQAALGIDLGKTGWFVGYRVDDPDAWALVKSGTLKAFSIGGRARRVPLEG